MSIKFLENRVLGQIRKMIRARIMPNRILLVTSKELDFPMADIRKALVDINKIQLKDLSERHGIYRSILSNTLLGKQKNAKAKQAIANSLGLTVEELFPLDEAA